MHAQQTNRLILRLPALAAAALLVCAAPAWAQFSTPATRTPAPAEQAPAPAPARRAPPAAAQQAPVPQAPIPQASAPQSGPGAPGPVERIAAVVNDDIVSMSDLQTRIQLALVSSGLPDTPEARQRLAPQVLRQLVDERLQLQEAKRLNIRVTDREIEEAHGRLAAQNRMSVDQLMGLLRSRSVPASALKEQTRAGIAWAKLVQRRLRPSVEIGDEEVDAVLQRIQANAGRPEYLVAEIFLAVDSPEQDEEVRRLAERLGEQVAQGASFPAVARQFSQSAGASQGGDLGWVQQGQLPEELDQALQQLRPGQVSRPIRGFTGYHLLLLREQRAVAAGGRPAETKVALKQIIVPRAPNQSAAALREAAERARADLSGCEAMDARIKAVGGPESGDVGTVRMADMPREVAEVVSRLAVGEASAPLVNERGAVVLMVCSREGGGGSLPSREEIANALANERLDMLQRRWLRDLRRGAFVDVRV
jgi:peptidyl-prolyl cis-trans isomerase SurA